MTYFVIGEGFVTEPKSLSSAGGGCPVTGAASATASATDAVMCPPVKFGRLFDKGGEDLDREARMKVAHSLIDLGTCMNNPTQCGEDAPPFDPPGDSEIPAGYTYLGQFIAHEITFDDTQDLLLVEPDPDDVRSPSLDLDGLYGAGPRDEKSKRLYEPKKTARLKIGRTTPNDGTITSFENDLPRDPLTGEALVSDPRNDENLPVAQTHVAFIKFHNRVVADLESGAYKQTAPPAPEELFETAQVEVIKHFQWIILKDYLPKLVDGEMLNAVIRKPSLYTPASEKKLFVPLEFSAAAFRIGHSMVRLRYTWNCKQERAVLLQLFSNTKFSGDLAGLPTLDTDWVIDWKRFYDFDDARFALDYAYDPPQSPPRNMAARIDTVFDLHLETIEGFHHLKQHDGQQPGEPDFNEQKALTIRNLLRGLALGLPWAEDVADCLQEKGLLTKEQRLTPEELRRGPHAKLLDAEAFGGKTPLWFYVLKEAREKGQGSKLGPIGGLIVAETLVGLIRHSLRSILKKVDGDESEWEFSDWRPAYARDEAEPPKFGMVDLLRAADVVDPLGRHTHEINHA